MKPQKKFEMNKDELFKEIELIQGCIERMSRNSFLVKGWALTLMAASLTLLKDEVLQNTVIFTACIMIPLICFWILDAFYLQAELKYRKMYEWVLDNRKNGDLSFQYDLNPTRFDKEVKCVFKVMFTKTLLPFYLAPPVIISLVIFILLMK